MRTARAILVTIPQLSSQFTKRSTTSLNVLLACFLQRGVGLGLDQTGKTSTIRRTSLPLTPLGPSQHYRIERFNTS